MRHAPPAGPAAAAPGAGHPAVRGYVLALIGAIAFSGKAVVAKLLYRHGIDALAAVALRMLLAWPFFLAMSWWGERGQAPLARGDRWRVVVLGVSGYYLASVLDFSGLQYISASLERLILFVYPTIVVLIVAARRRQRVTRRQALALAVSYAGVLLAFGHEAGASLQQPGARVAWGGLLVLGCAVSYSVYLVLSGEMVARLGALRLIGLASGIACALCLGHYALDRLLAGAPLHGGRALFDFTPAVWELSLVNATLCTVLPIWMVMRAMELIGAPHTAQVGMVGPVSTLLLSMWLLQEPYSAPMLMGTVLVLLGVGLLPRRATAPAPPPAVVREDTGGLAPPPL